MKKHNLTNVSNCISNNSDRIENKSLLFELSDKSIIGLYKYNSETDNIENIWNSRINDIDVIGIIELEDRIKIYSSQGKILLDDIINKIPTSITLNEHGDNMKYNLTNINNVDSNDIIYMTLEDNDELVSLSSTYIHIH